MLTASTQQPVDPMELSDFRSSVVHPRKAITCVLSTVVVICVVALAIGCIVVVREYDMSRAYSKASCRIANVSHAASDVHCLFCSGVVDKSKEGKMETCQSVAFPCLQIWVEYTKSAVTKRVLLYSDSNQASGQHSHCSFTVSCSETRSENLKQTDQFAEEIISRNKNKTFICYFDTETNDNAILQKLYTKTDVFHCVFWPLLVIFICGAAILYVEVRGNDMTLCPCTDNSKLNTSGSGAEEGHQHPPYHLTTRYPPGPRRKT